MTTYPRYAIYYAPEAGSRLDRFGAALLGYDAYGGEEMPFPDGVTRAAPDWRKLTEDPRKYGFHATLKAPISMVAGKTEAELAAACKAFADAPRRIPVIEPIVNSIGDFIAIVPVQPPTELVQLAADCTREFDSFRTPLTAEDRVRRNLAKLTPRQCEYLERWGYPYVFEDYRFHMTLTGRLNTARRESLLTMLRDRFSIIGVKAVSVDRISLFRQPDAESRFRIIGQWPLRSNDG
jgi:putative phosphonate metabolism protein